MRGEECLLGVLIKRLALIGTFVGARLSKGLLLETSEPGGLSGVVHPNASDSVCCQGSYMRACDSLSPAVADLGQSVCTLF